jgi:transcriptional regulator with XRE-family HTH domain
MNEKKQSRASDLVRAREVLELTREELARALQVAPRTIQNWERRATGDMERKTRDLRELLELLGNYVRPGKESAWLRTKLEAFGDKRPLDLLVEGRVRELIAEFRRLQEGQPV